MSEAPDRADVAADLRTLADLIEAGDLGPTGDAWIRQITDRGLTLEVVYTPSAFVDAAEAIGADRVTESDDFFRAERRIGTINVAVSGWKKTCGEAVERTETVTTLVVPADLDHLVTEAAS